MANTTVIKTIIQLRRGTTAEWEQNKTVVPAAGEPCFDLQLGTLKIGNGVSSYEALDAIGGGGSVTVSADGASIVLDNDVFKLAGFDAAATGAQPRKKANGTLEWIVPTVDVDDLEDRVTEVADRVDDLEDKVADVEDAVDVLNGNENINGSVLKIVKDEINAFATKVSNDGTVNTFKELIDYVDTHNDAAADIVADITTLQTLVGNTPVADQINAAVAANGIESVSVGGTELPVVDKGVNIPVATNTTLGVVKGSSDIVIAADGSLELAKDISGDGKTVNVAGDGIVSLAGINGLAFTEQNANGDTVNVTYQPVLTGTGLIWSKPSATTVEGLNTEISGVKTELATAEADINALETLLGNDGTDGGETTGLFKATEDNADAIAAEVTAREEAITAVEDKIGTVPAGKTVIEMIAEVQSASTYDDTQVKADIAAIEADYLKAADKTELADAIAAEKTRAEAAEQVNADAIAILNGNASVNGSVDKKVADAINVFATQMSDDNTVNTYKELINYAATHGAEFTELVGKVALNTAALETLNDDAGGAGSIDKKIEDALADADLVKADDITDVTDRLDALEGNTLTTTDKTELQGNIDAKADATTVEDIDDRVADLEAIGAEKNVVSTVDNTQFALDANRNLTLLDVPMSKITGLEDALDDKVTAEAGKGLSTNDFTDALETKLNGIAEGAQVNVIESVDTAQFGLDAAKHLTLLDIEIGKVTGLQDALDDKANAGTTLAAYGITDAYTKTETESRIQEVLDGITDNSESAASVSQALGTYKTANDARVDAVEGDIDDLEELVGTTKVADQITAAIAAQDLANIYAEKTHTHVQTEITGLADAIADAKQAGTDAAAALTAYQTTNDAAVQANTNAITAIKDGTSIDSFADVETALADKQATGDYATKAEAQGYADAKDAAIAEAKQAGVDAATALAEYKTSNNAASQANMDAITAIKDGTTIDSFADVEAALAGKQDTGDYSTKDEAKGYADAKDTAIQAAQQAADDAQDEVNALETLIGTLPTGITATTVIGYIDERTASVPSDTAVQLLTGRVDDAEDAIDAIEADYLKATDKTELQGKIDTLANGAVKNNTEAIELLNADASTNGSVDYKIALQFSTLLENPDDAMNSIQELVDWTTEHAADALALNNQVMDNKNAIMALNGDVNTTGSVAKKIAEAIAAENLAQYATDDELTTLAGRVEAVEDDLNDATTGIKARLDAAEADVAALETKMGNDTVAAQISAAISGLQTGDIDDVKERITELEAKSHEHANQAVIDGIEDADITAWDAKVDAVTAAADSGLKATRTDNAVEIDFDDSVTWVFDGGTSADV